MSQPETAIMRIWNFSVVSPELGKPPTSYSIVSPSFIIRSAIHQPYEEPIIIEEDDSSEYEGGGAVYAATSAGSDFRKILIPRGYTLFAALGYPSDPAYEDSHTMLGIDTIRGVESESVSAARTALQGITNQLELLAIDRKVASQVNTYNHGKELHPESFGGLVSILEDPEITRDVVPGDLSDIDFFFVGHS